MNDWPADKVDRRSIAELIPYARNARTHSPEQVAQLAASIREWGWTIPVLIDEDGGIIAGHGRIMAAQMLGLVDVPCMVASGWTKAQKQAYTLADNKLALNAGWDLDALRVELQEIQASTFDELLTGFTADEFAALTVDKTIGLMDPEETPELQEHDVTDIGDVWVFGNHRLMCGDSTSADDVSTLLNGAIPHLMVTDPPYGVEYDANWRNQMDKAIGKAGAGRAIGKVSNDDRADWREAWALFPGDVGYVWHAGIHGRTVADSLEACGLAIRAQLIWVKSRFVLSRGHYHVQHEPCWYAVRKGATGHWQGDRTQSTLWQIEHRKSETGHSTQKPIECMRRPIVNNSAAGQSVYEPFSGSGTTIIACEMEGRHAYAMELHPPYVDMAIRRWQNFTGKQAIRESDNMLFDELAASRNPELPELDTAQTA